MGKPAPVTLAVSPNLFDVDNSDAATPVIAGIRYDADGDYYISDAGGTYGSGGTWLTVGLNSEVWVERTVSAGTLDTDPGAGRLVLSTSRTYQESNSSVGTESSTITWDFYDAAAGGNLLATTTHDLIATVDAP